MSEVGEALLLMQWHRIVDLGSDAASREMLPQQVAIPHANDVLVVDVPAPFGGCRRLDGPAEVGPREGPVIESCIALAGPRPLVQMLELDIEHSRLQLIEPEIPPCEGVKIFR